MPDEDPIIDYQRRREEMLKRLQAVKTGSDEWLELMKEYQRDFTPHGEH